MPFVLLIIGIVFLVSAVRGTQNDLGGLIVKDFTGPKNFVYWVIVLLLIGSLGYIPKLKSLSVSFLALVLLVLILTRGNPDLQKNSGGGFFAQFTSAVATTTAAQPAATTQASSANTITSLSSLIPSLPTLPTLH
jgi:hypothetical protein